MVTSRYKSLLTGWLEPIARALARAGVAPNALTLAGPVLTPLACLWYVRTAGAAPVLGAAEVTGYWILSMIVLAGALIVSYAKARAAMEVAISNLEWPDLMERGERGDRKS